jgi:serine/threonine-protein kinase
MSPEQARGEPLDARSDLFGLGAVVYEMVTGVPPYFGATLADVYAQLLNEATPAPPLGAPGRCPPALDAILAKAIATRRADRFPDVRRFLAALYEAGC